MNLKKLLACSTSVLALALMAGTAYAQDQAMETVVVTGIRASLASAQDIKKNADQFVDSIVAEDIGKLPDNQVVDALQHVTGLQVQHGNGSGENNQIWIRGLPDIATTLNGREIFNTTGRFVALADIPAELLQRLDVHKSATAQDLEGGLAAWLTSACTVRSISTAFSSPAACRARTPPWQSISIRLQAYSSATAGRLRPASSVRFWTSATRRLTTSTRMPSTIMKASMCIRHRRHAGR